MNNYKIYVLSALLLVFSGCGSQDNTADDNIIPPYKRTTATLRGVAQFVQNATVSVYEIDTNKLLGEGSTNQFGHFVIDLTSKSTSLRVEVGKGGQLIDNTNKVISFDERRLYAVYNYNFPNDDTIAVSFYTTLATGLAENNISNGMNVNEAVALANSVISSEFDFDILSVLPVEITETPGSALDRVTPEYKYGFANAAITQYAETKNVDYLDVVKSVYEDVKGDGLLNAIEPTEVRINNFRQDLIDSLMLTIVSSKNSTGLTKNDLFFMARRWGESEQVMKSPTVSFRSTINGIVFDGRLDGADVKVYTYDSGIKGDLLGSGSTGNDGKFTISIDALDLPISIEVTGGFYNEIASGRQVDLRPNQVLRTFTINQPQSTLNLSVTPWTNIAAAEAQYKIRNGETVEQAIIDANGLISVIAVIDNVVTTIPKDITVVANAARTLNDELKYGFLLGGVSQWTLNLSRLNEPEAIHSTINSIEFAMVDYEDVLADGLRNGMGAEGNLSFAGARVNANTYRNEIALGMFDVTRNINNQTGMTATDIKDFVIAYNGNQSPIYGLLDTIPLPLGGPSLRNIVPEENSVIFGSVGIAPNIFDIFGLNSVSATMGLNTSAAAKPNNPLLNFNVGSLADGRNILNLRATNMEGVAKDFVVDYVVDNKRYIYLHYPFYTATVSERFEVYEYNVATGEIIRIFRKEVGINATTEIESVYVVNPAKNRLYMAGPYGNGSIHIWNLSSRHIPTANNANLIQTLATSEISMRSMLFNNTGAFCYIEWNAAGGGTKIAIHNVDPTTGELTQSSVMDVSGSGLQFHPSKPYAYLSGDGVIMAYKVSAADGSLTLINKFSARSTIRRVFDLKTNTIWFFGQSNNIIGLSIDDASGALGLANSYPFPGYFSNLYIHKSLKYIYERTPLDGMKVYTFDKANGMVNEIIGSPFAYPAGYENTSSGYKYTVMDDGGDYLFTVVKKIDQPTTNDEFTFIMYQINKDTGKLTGPTMIASSNSYGHSMILSNGE